MPNPEFGGDKPLETGGRVLTRREILKLGVAASAGVLVGTRLVSPGNVFAVNLNPDFAARVETPLSITDILKPLLMDREQLEREWKEQGSAHYSIPDVVHVVDETGNTTRILTLVAKRIDPPYAVKKQGAIYETDLNPTAGQFLKYVPTSIFNKILMGNPNALAVSQDGKSGFVGGEDPWGSGIAKIVPFFDGWSRPGTAVWPFPPAGGIIDSLPLAGNSYLVNLGNFEGMGSSLYIAELDPAAENINVRATNISGSAHGLSIADVDVPTRTFLAFANGSFTLQKGLVVYRGSIDSGSINAEHIDKVIIDGTKVSLPYMYGKGQYQDQNGDSHIVASDPDNQYLYDINLATKNAFRRNYRLLFDNKGIANYRSGTLEIYDTLLITGPDGSIHLWFCGAGSPPHEGNGWPLAGHCPWETDPKKGFGEATPYPIAPNTPSGAFKLQLRKIVSQPVLEIASTAFDRALLPISPDWNPLPGAEPLFAVRGLGSESVIRRVFTPFIAKFFPGGW